RKCAPRTSGWSHGWKRRKAKSFPLATLAGERVRVRGSLFGHRAGPVTDHLHRLRLEGLQATGGHGPRHPLLSVRIPSFPENASTLLRKIIGCATYTRPIRDPHESCRAQIPH